MTEGILRAHVSEARRIDLSCSSDSIAGSCFLRRCLIAAPIGFLMLVRDPATRIPGVAAMSIALYYLLFNASYYLLGWRMVVRVPDTSRRRCRS